MNQNAVLTKQETTVAELIAWGATKKDVANRLFISVHTVENHCRNIFDKVGVTKANELSAWWFCHNYHISFDLSPIKRQIVAAILLLMLLPQIANDCSVRINNSRTVARTVRLSRNRKIEDNNKTIIIS